MDPDLEVILQRCDSKMFSISYKGLKVDYGIESDHCHNQPSSLCKRCVDQALEVIIQQVNCFNETSLTCSPSVEGRCVILIIVVA